VQQAVHERRRDGRAVEPVVPNGVVRPDGIVVVVVVRLTAVVVVVVVGAAVVVVVRCIA
jgi:hypothetical protein